jgi:hypothetical protein
MIGFKAGMIGIAACAAIGCATSVKTDHDPKANFQQYRTFAVAKTKVVTDGEREAQDTQITRDIEAAITTELFNKGIHPARDEKPDLLVAFSAGNRTNRQMDAVWMSNGRYHTAASDGHEVWVDRDLPSGTLVIDFIDADTRKLVFRSVAEVAEDQLIDRQVIDRTVDKALKKFPSA